MKKKDPDSPTVSWHRLAKLINEEKFEKIAEIGVYGGSLFRRLIPLCEYLKEYWAIDSWMPYEQMDGDWNDLYKLVCSEMIKFPELKVIKMPSVEAVTIFPDEYFDFIFLDANHEYKFVKEDIHLWYPKIRKGGIFSGHDYKAGGKFKYWGVKKAVDEIFGNKVEEMKHKIFLVRK